jgi:hypothetical protein
VLDLKCKSETKGTVLVELASRTTLAPSELHI